MPVTTPALPETIAIPEASLPVLFSDAARVVPTVPIVKCRDVQYFWNNIGLGLHEKISNVNAEYYP